MGNHTDLLTADTGAAGTDGPPTPEAAPPAALPPDVAGATPAAPLEVAEGHRWLLGSLLAGAGVVHLVMAPSHLDVSAVEGVGFFVAGWLQIALATGLATRPARWMLQLAVLANAVFIATWAVSRTAGLPFGEHSGHAESASFVDLSVVGLELVAIVAAALLLAGRRPVLPAAGALAALAPLAVVALATAAVASPGALDHANGAHGDHAAGAGAGTGGHAHGGEAAAADDRGLSLLENGHQHDTGVVELDDATQAELDAELAYTADVIEQYPTVADAEAAGYWRAGPFVPGLGAHYVGEGATSNTDGDIDPEDPGHALLIYDGVEPDSPLAGFMFMAAGQEEPEGFTGPNDHWHYHERVCIVPRADGGVDTPFGADSPDVTEEMCEDAGGQFISNTGHMLHVWTVPGYESERGVFSEINPAITCPDGSYYMIPTEEWATRDSTCRNA